MGALMDQGATSDLERSCGPPHADRIRVAPSSRGLERIEASFSRHAFAPHRHDTYTIGLTFHGVQAFSYRRESCYSLPGHAFVLHPDELHDGRAGTSEGLRYRAIYVEPRLIREALGDGRPLPFVRDAVSSDGRLAAAIAPALEDLDLRIEELQRDQIVSDLADALAATDASTVRQGSSARHRQAAEKVRDLLESSADRAVTSVQLEEVSGMTRYATARHFRACFGTSPYRYLLMRRLDRARRRIARGMPLAEAALASGFADQSHMTRHFKKAYGLTPGRWAQLTG
jgi:AraC-like DNA-binding protein